MGRRENLKDVNLVMAVNKPVGITTFDLIRQLQRRFNVGKSGHTGTLDPFAEGLVVVCINEATKLVPYLQDGRKCYLVTMRVGLRTDSFDITGEEVERREVAMPPDNEIEAALLPFVGKIMQRVPPLAAVKYKGKPLYWYTRHGISVELPEREVEIYRLELRSVVGDTVDLYAEVSPGTYIRRLVDDLGERLGTLATTTKLSRTSNSGFLLDDAKALEELADRNAVIEHGRSLQEVLGHLPAMQLSAAEVDLLANGGFVPLDEERLTAVPEARRDGPIRAMTPEGLLKGIARIVSDEKGFLLRPERLINRPA